MKYNYIVFSMALVFSKGALNLFPISRLETYIKNNISLFPIPDWEHILT
ncbi:hypothetical protein BH10BAC5_BH10BAC5_24010 [soil metagenome]